jgi:hypothetical protein
MTAMADFFEELRQLVDSPWNPPETLTIEVLDALSKQPRIWLADIIKAMTGLPDNSAEPPPLGPGSYWRAAENAAQRQQVAATLFKAARAADHPVFIGSRDRLSDQLIPQEYFDIPRTLDSEDNSVRADMERVRDAQFDAEMANPQKWLNVRVDGAWVADWLKSQLGIIPQQSSPIRKIPPLHAKILEIARSLWPDGKLPARVSGRNKQICQAWPAGETHPNDRTFQRAFKHWPK